MMQKKVSILISNHSAERLEEILHHLFASPDSAELEIVYVDDVIDARTWQVACHYVERYPAQMTVSRNRVPLGSRRNRVNLLRMATYRVYALTSEESDVDIDVVLTETSEYLRLGYQKNFFALSVNTRLVRLRSGEVDGALFSGSKPGQELPMLSRNPLVSVSVHNFNYGRFLRQCLESLVNQTYPNIRVIFSDNASDDDSWKIANEFADRYPRKFTITRNRINMGSKVNVQNCEFHVEGDYYLQLCSDDYLATDCIEKCVAALKANPDAGMMIFHRAIVDAAGQIKEDLPFFNRPFRAPAGSIADIYLMSSITPSISQIIYNNKVAPPIIERTLIDRWFENRFRDFIISIEYPVLYSDEPLLFHRIHRLNDNIEAAKHLIEVIGPYVANLEFELIANERNKQLKNSGKWLEKVASLSLRYSYRALLSGESEQAKRYLHLSAAIAPSSSESEIYRQLSSALYGPSPEAAQALLALQKAPALQARTLSYDPPQDAQPL